MNRKEADLPFRLLAVFSRASLLCVALAAAVTLAYSNSLQGPFVFDDLPSITANPTIRQLDSTVLSPPVGLTVSGRPLVNLSLALNYAMGGEDVRGYHLINVGIHMLGTLCLFGLLRRTFSSGRLRGFFGAGTDGVAFAAALLWALHPLQTQAVTYVIQRAEALMGLLYLLTLCCFARAHENPARKTGAVGVGQSGWLMLSVAACTLGMASKEVMVSAPLAVLLYDRVFVAKSFRELWCARRGYYLSLAGTWLLLAFLVWRTGDRGNTAGFSIGISSFDYALTQSGALVRYLRLMFWPHPLVFDYGEYEPPVVPAMLPAAAVVVALLAGTLWLWRRHGPAAFAASLFFLILAPTSSVLPIFTEPVAEHRMYLPLAALIGLFAGALHRWIGSRATASLIVLAMLAGVATYRRNHDYRSARTLWETTVAAEPRNARAHTSLATALVEEQVWTGAERHFNAALALRPDSIAARAGLSALLANQHRLDEAEAQCLALLERRPAHAITHNMLGTVRYEQGRFEDAARDFERAIQCDPDFAQAYNNLGGVLVDLGRVSEARAHLETALRLTPDYAEAHYNLGNMLVHEGRLPDARRFYEEALRLKPDYASAHAHLGVVLQNLGERASAILHYREALRLQPEFAFVRENLRTLGVDP